MPASPRAKAPLTRPKPAASTHANAAPALASRPGGGSDGAASRSKARDNAQITFARLSKAHPDAHCELDHRNPFELVVATVLSAQTTDVLVNKVTPELFTRFPDPAALANADVGEVERLLSRIGMFRQKAKNIVGLARMLVERHGGRVPRTLDELIELPGVGRKTANVVLGVAFQAPEGVVVDTHVQRLSQRLGWTRETAPEKIERDLMALFPRDEWDRLSHVLIFHGRRVCFARKPACASCTINDLCPSAFRAENVGRKAPRTRPPAARADADGRAPTPLAAAVASSRRAPARTGAGSRSKGENGSFAAPKSPARSIHPRARSAAKASGAGVRAAAAPAAAASRKHPRAKR